MRRRLRELLGFTARPTSAAKHHDPPTGLQQPQASGNPQSAPGPGLYSYILWGGSLQCNLDPLPYVYNTIRDSICLQLRPSGMPLSHADSPMRMMLHRTSRGQRMASPNYWKVLVPEPLLHLQRLEECMRGIMAEPDLRLSFLRCNLLATESCSTPTLLLPDCLQTALSR